MRKIKKLSDGFKQFHGITDNEEKFFDFIYKRERRMKAIIAILIAAIIVLSLWKL